MWVRSQNGEHILNVEHFRSLPLDNGEVNILAKLPRDTVILGTYSKDQGEGIMRDLWHIVGLDQPYRTNYYTMPPRWEEEEE
ncbi:hypothetical protein KCG48_05100 [Proteiniclasticum sp. BAD-10]|uniref:Uncharacterized protein n=1 Tax=Proteiniclasticum sediminis TaxID=2804028 RepID=A0A941CQX6_9CLOT|nr:hypothetical protein [Proteiniclasticum sediminis]MBR0575718.1 hypothetical protein [Proteiniclasticum sediminis]